MSCAITAILAASELALGSYLHLLHIPFTGQLMSLNQCFWLNVSKNWSPDTSAAKISLQVAAIKAMSPVGKRITPMLAISIQGLLFELGTLCFGATLVGRVVGSVLMSLWALIQPFLIYLLFLGNALFEMADFFGEKLGVDPATAVCLVVSLKVFGAISVSVVAGTLSRPFIERYGQWIQRLDIALKPKRRRFFRSPLFFSIAVATLYFYLTLGLSELFIRKALFSISWMLAMHYLLNVVLRTKRFARRPV